MTDAAQDHQEIFERIERAPFQMALFLQDQPVKRASLSSGLRVGDTVRGARGLPAVVHVLVIVRCGPSWRTFSACGPRSLASLSWIGLLIARSRSCPHCLTTLTPIFSSLASAWCSRSKATVGSFLLTSSAAACTHFFCSSFRLLPDLVADEQCGIVGFVLGERKHRRRLVVFVDEVVVDAVLGHVGDAGLQRRIDLAECHVHDLRAIGREGRVFGHRRLHAHLDALEVGNLLDRLLAVHVPQALRAQANHVRARHLGGI